MSNSFGYQIERDFQIPLSDLFEAMLDDNILKNLWRLNNFTITSEAPRKAYAEMVLGGDDWSFELVYDSIIRDEYLSWKVRFERTPEKEIQVSIKFSGDSDSGKMIVNQSNFDSQEETDANENAWKASLEKLEDLIQK